VSAIDLFRVTIIRSQNNQFVNFSARKTITKSVAYAAAYRKHCAYRDRCFFDRKAEIYALERMNLLKFIDSDSQAMSRAFFMMSVLFDRLSIHWFQRKGDQ
jgi:hypothetical protein